MDRFSSRKFLLVLGTLCTATVLLWFGKINQEVWDNIMDWLISAYIVGNIAGKTKLVQPPCNDNGTQK